VHRLSLIRIRSEWRYPLCCIAFLLFSFLVILFLVQNKTKLFYSISNHEKRRNDIEDGTFIYCLSFVFVVTHRFLRRTIDLQDMSYEQVTSFYGKTTDAHPYSNGSCYYVSFPFLTFNQHRVVIDCYFLIRFEQ
jgi:hypothetical protein